MLSEISKTIGDITDKSKPWYVKLIIVTVFIIIGITVESVYKLSYNLHLNNKLSQLETIQKLKTSLKEDSINYNEVLKLEREIINKKHYSETFFSDYYSDLEDSLFSLQIKLSLYKKQYSKLESDYYKLEYYIKDSTSSAISDSIKYRLKFFEDLKMTQILNENSFKKEQIKKLSLFWVLVSSSYPFLMLMLLFILAPIFDKSLSFSEYLIGMPIANFVLGVFTWVSYSIALNIPIIWDYPIYNYIIYAIAIFPTLIPLIHKIRKDGL